MLVSVLLVLALTLTRSSATCTDNLAQKKASLEAKASTEKEEVLRWTEMTQSAQSRFAAAKRQLIAVKADLRISQEEVLAASNRVHCAQSKLAALDQLSCQLRDKLDEENQRKIGLERNINLRTARKRKRETRQALNPAPLNERAEFRRVLPANSPKPVANNSVSSQLELGPDLDLSKLADIEMLRKSLDPIYRQTIDSLAWQSLERTPSKKEAVARPRQAVVSGSSNVEAANSKKPATRCDQKEQDEAAALRKVKLEIFQDEASLREADSQLESVRTLLSAEQDRLDQISRRICSIRYDLRDSDRSAHEKLDALLQAQTQAAAHQDILADTTKQLQAVVAEMLHREMDELTKHKVDAEQT